MYLGTTVVETNEREKEHFIPDGYNEFMMCTFTTIFFIKKLTLFYRRNYYNPAMKQGDIKFCCLNMKQKFSNMKHWCQSLWKLQGEYAHWKKYFRYMNL